MSVRIHSFVTGPLRTNTYLVADGGQCWIVDPGGDPSEIVECIRRLELTPAKILLTHGHGDHIAGAGRLKDAFDGLPLACPAGDEHMLSDPQMNLSEPFGFALTAPPADELLRPGQDLTLGESLWRVLDTSGHTPGGVSFYCAAEAVVIVGDTLFAAGIGRTDIPGASAGRLIGNIRENLFSLPATTRVLAGHGPETTIGAEKPYLGAGPEPAG